jgi:hypothetical protein
VEQPRVRDGDGAWSAKLKSDLRMGEGGRGSERMTMTPGPLLAQERHRGSSGGRAQYSEVVGY